MQLIVIIGCGYTGLALARRWRERGAQVLATATRPESLAAIAATGTQPIELDLDRVAKPLDVHDGVLYYTVPPAPSGTGDARLARLLASVIGTPARIVYLSTTGVYGDHRGAPVDETTPVTPLTGRALRRVAAEQVLRSWAAEHAVSWCILRVAGIYGPGRLPLERLRRAEPAIDPAEASPGNRIHVNDLVRACLAAGADARADGRIYNVCDGTHDSLTAWLQRVARIAGLPAPPLVSRAEAERQLPAAMWSFLGESRRVVNRRMLEELGVVLEFADLDAGIRASLAAG